MRYNVWKNITPRKYYNFLRATSQKLLARDNGKWKKKSCQKLIFFFLWLQSNAYIISSSPSFIIFHMVPPIMWPVAYGVMLRPWPRPENQDDMCLSENIFSRRRDTLTYNSSANTHGNLFLRVYIFRKNHSNYLNEMTDPSLIN